MDGGGEKKTSGWKEGLGAEAERREGKVTEKGNGALVVGHLKDRRP